MTNKPTNLVLANAVEMPLLGLGVYRSSPKETVNAVSAALRTGYRLIDTAAAYRNEAQVGEASVAVLVSRTMPPFPSTTHTCVSFIETSSPAKNSMAALLVALGSRSYRTPGRAAAPITQC
jgi:predicted aldo/keto reductase-like oxidoreductase